MLWLLLPVLLLIYLLYRRGGVRPKPWAGVWLWRRGRARRFRPRLDLRLWLLLLAGAALVLALEDPPLLPSPLVLVVDTSASMAAQEGRRTRLDLAKERALPLLERAPEAVLVEAGETPRAYGPAPGVALRGRLLALEARAGGADLEGGVALGRRLMRAPVVVATDGPPPPGVEGYLGVGSPAENLGIVAVAGGFLAVGNGGFSLRTARVLVEGRPYTLPVPPRGYARLEGLPPTFQARLLGEDALPLDDTAGFALRPLGVRLPPRPALLRLFALLGARPGDEVRVEVGSPTGAPERPTLYLAREGGAPAAVLATLPHPLLEGVALLGARLPAPPPPPPPWRPLAEGEGGVGLIYWTEEGLYLPPLSALEDKPFLPLLVYNFLRPYREARSGLLSPQETLLPTPGESFLPEGQGGGGRFFALLALGLLLLELALWPRRKVA